MILSGGDPLSLSTPKLAELTDALATIPHIRRLRIHTRLPIVLPERVDAELLAWLGALPFRRVVVVHANHPNEIDASVAVACATPARQRRDVAEPVGPAARRSTTTSIRCAPLSERLFECGVLPYYLHQLDRVPARPISRFRRRAARAISCGISPRGCRDTWCLAWSGKSAGAASKMPL